MAEYLVALALVAVICGFGILIIRLSEFSSDGHTVEIIIDGDASSENIEMLIRSAKVLAERYLPGARIYIQGGNDEEINILCRCFGVERKV